MGDKMAIKQNKTRRISQRQPKFNVKMDNLATTMLEQAQALFEGSSYLDTIIRDITAEGLARIVYCAYDTQAIAARTEFTEGTLSDFDAVNYIQSKTYDWFREKGFVEWFCVGASTLFRTTPREFYRMKAKKARSGKATIISKEKIG